MDYYEYLPNEILFQILVKLPVKSLVRFRCVSKFWYSRIGKFKFMLSHLHHNQVSGNYTVLFRKYCQDCKMENYSLHADNQYFPEIETLDFPFQSSSDHFSIVGSINGLICLWDNNSRTLMLWNPSIRKCMTLPKFELKPPVKLGKRMRFYWNPEVLRDMCFGFGFDALSNDFKVVRIIFYRDELALNDYDVHDTKSSVSVLSLRRKSWRKLDYNAPLQMYSRSCNVGGFVYRLTPILGNNQLKIVSFDLSAEVFTEIACPDEARFVRRCTPELTIFRDSLALLDEWDYKRYHIWAMKENDGMDKSWTKLFSVDLDVGEPGQRIVGFSMKGLMLVAVEGSLLVSPIVEDVEVVKHLPPCPESAWHLESYVESLALLKEADNLPPNLAIVM